MADTCIKHGMTHAQATCGQCGHAFCAECLVFPFGRSKPAMCIGCALAFSGVNRRAAPPTRRPQRRPGWSERRARKKLPTLPSQPAELDQVFDDVEDPGIVDGPRLGDDIFGDAPFGRPSVDAQSADDLSAVLGSLRG